MNQGESHFLDSSAVVKLYVREPGSPRVLSLRESAPPGMVVVSGITPVEVTSALVRRCGQGHFGVTELNTALDLLTRDAANFRIIAIEDAILERAIIMIRRYGLRSADAIQLACAVSYREHMKEGQSVTLLSSDRELNAAASGEGFSVIDPAQTE